MQGQSKDRGRSEQLVLGLSPAKLLLQHLPACFLIFRITEASSLGCVCGHQQCASPPQVMLKPSRSLIRAMTVVTSSLWVLLVVLGSLG